MYVFESRVRYSEVDEDGRLTPFSLINYLQDCSTFQSEDIGVGIEWLEKKKRAWLLSSWRIVIDRLPRLGEHITVGTFPYGFKGIYGYRHFYIEDEKKELIVRADSLWFLYDVGTGVPVKVSEEHMAPYVTEKLDLNMGEMKRKIKVPEEFVRGRSTEVLSYHLDTNRHVNNARYVEIATEAAGIRHRDITEIQTEYKKAAVSGDIMYSRISDVEDGKVVLLCNPDGEAYAIVRFLLKGESKKP